MACGTPILWLSEPFLCPRGAVRMQVWRGSFYPFPVHLLQYHHVCVTRGLLGAAMDRQLLGVPWGCSGHCSWQEGCTRVNSEGRTGQEAEISVAAGLSTDVSHYKTHACPISSSRGPGRAAQELLLSAGDVFSVFSGRLGEAQHLPGFC